MMIINGEDCCEISANGWPCQCHLWRNRNDDELGDWQRDQAKDRKLEREDEDNDHLK